MVDYKKSLTNFNMGLVRRSFSIIWKDMTVMTDSEVCWSISHCLGAGCVLAERINPPKCHFPVSILSKAPAGEVLTSGVC